MVERLCMNYGTKLEHPGDVKAEVVEAAVPEKDPVSCCQFL